MHRRNRHLTGRAAGSTVHYDARRLNLSDGTAIQTLTDVAGTNNATQSTLANRPLFKTNILNGNPVVRFDGTNDYLSLTTNLNITGEWSNIVVFKAASVMPSFCTSSLSNYTPYINFLVGTTMYSIAGNSKAFDSSGFVASSFVIVTTYTNSSSVYQIYRNGISQNAVNQNFFIPDNLCGVVGARLASGSYADGDIAAAIHIPGSRSVSLRKRFEHSMGFSFKIACS